MLHADAGAIDDWLRGEVTRSYDEYKADPSIAIPAGKIMSRLRKRHTTPQEKSW
jgi:hypothetical protein